MSVKKPFTIAMVGAPASGKSTAAAMLHAELLQLGLPARLVQEQASAYLGGGGKLEVPEDQMTVTHFQMHKELEAMGQGFSPVICDSAVWLGEVYMDRMLAKFPKFDRTRAIPKLTSALHYYEVMKKYKGAYHVTVMCPLFSDESKVTRFRIHNREQSQELQDAIVVSLMAGNINHTILPKDLADRPAAIKKLALEIFSAMEEIANPQQQAVGNA